MPGDEKETVGYENSFGGAGEVGGDVDAEENLNDLDVSEVSIDHGR